MNKLTRAELDRDALLTWILAVATDEQLDVLVPGLNNVTGRQLVTAVQERRKR